MLDKKKLSIIIITKDEESNIKRCLDSVSWADEIIVVDSFSTDNTIGICREYTDKIFQKEFTDFADMKNFALSKASNEWALSIDADEELLGALKDEINNKIDIPQVFSAFKIKRNSQIFGRWFKYSGTQNDFQVRLFRKNCVEYYQPVHEKVSVSGKIGYLSNPILHYTYKNMSDYIKRLDRYTSIEAKQILSQSFLRKFIFLLLKPFWRFTDMYLLKQGFRDGFEGFLFCVLSAFYEFCKYIKAIYRQ